MSAWTGPRQRPGSVRAVRGIDLPVKAGSKILGGTMGTTDTTGYAVNTTAAAGLIFWGRTTETKDNTSGGNGALKVNVEFTTERWLTLWENDTTTPVTQAMIGTQIHMLDNQTVTGDPGVGSAGPYVYSVDSEGVWTWDPTH